MQRRSFLKAVLGGAGYLMMPAIPQVQANSIYTAEGLTLALEKMFNCKMGEPRAFMELTKSQAQRFLTPAAYAVALSNTDLVSKKEEQGIMYLYPKGSNGYNQAMAEIAPKDGVIRINYQTFAYAIEGGSAVEAEAKLAQYFYEEFQKLADNRNPMLIWRVQPHFQSDEITKYGDIWMTAEQIEDRIDLDEKLNVILDGYEHGYHGRINKWAFKVPRQEERPPIQVPAGVEYDYETGSLRYVKEKTMLHKMRMRLSIPENIIAEEYQAMAKPEGLPIPKLEEQHG